ncbi:hypothetical protein AACT_0592 [Arcobacter acticola]|jgi:hypothetical protein|uniref:Uncharacterized protein n=1 Tax=Arcobacter acticola TaxID=1849015 RepID=A0A6M8EGQ5_9BACT|nr:hypothetical protein [Arcobacter acticola]QKE27798.1 hypothetical protein AACT_0592 [Arcobacter acticola]
MLITLDIKNESKKESFLNFLSTLDYIEIKSQEEEKQPNSKKDKFNEFAGLWENKNIDLQTIREKAWK